MMTRNVVIKSFRLLGIVALLLVGVVATAQDGAGTRSKNPHTKSKSIVDQSRFNTPMGRVGSAKIGLLIGGRAGVAIGSGDLVDDGKCGFTASFIVEKEVNAWLNIRGALEGGFCQGGQVEGDGYRTVFGALEAGIKFRFLDLALSYDNQRRFNPYLTLGAGGNFYHPVKKIREGTGFGAAMHQALSEGKLPKFLDVKSFKATGLAFGGGGCVVYINPKISAFAEAHENIVFTDDFDSHQGWEDGQGNWVDSKCKFDFYQTVSIGVLYRFFPASKYFTKHKLGNGSYGSAQRSSSRNGNRLRRR